MGAWQNAKIYVVMYCTGPRKNRRELMDDGLWMKSKCGQRGSRMITDGTVIGIEVKSENEGVLRCTRFARMAVHSR